jgi:arsenate reductase
MTEKSILFLCPDNSCSSQMAEAIARRLAPPDVRIRSAGLCSMEIHPMLADVMAEVGIDISSLHSKDLRSIRMDEVDLVVTLGMAKESCPSFPRRIRIEHWPIPYDQQARGGDAAVRAVLCFLRDTIDGHVGGLFLDYWRNVA